MDNLANITFELNSIVLIFCLISERVLKIDVICRWQPLLDVISFMTTISTTQKTEPLLSLYYCRL